MNFPSTDRERASEERDGCCPVKQNWNPYSFQGGWVGISQIHSIEYREYLFG